MTTLELIKSDLRAAGRNSSLIEIVKAFLFLYSAKPLIFIRLANKMGGGKALHNIKNTKKEISYRTWLS